MKHGLYPSIHTETLLISHQNHVIRKVIGLIEANPKMTAGQVKEYLKGGVR